MLLNARLRTMCNSLRLSSLTLAVIRLISAGSPAGKPATNPRSSPRPSALISARLRPLSYTGTLISASKRIASL